MKVSFQLLNLFIWATVICGCAPKVIKAIPTIEYTVTQTQVIVASPKPSATIAWTIVPGTETSSPSATIPIATATKTQAWPDVPLEICQPGELEIYLAELSPIADQIIILAREVTQLDELSKSRAEEILGETIILKPALEKMLVPTCLEDTHQKAIDSLNLLESSINSVLKEDFDKARRDLEESFFAITRSVAEIAVMSWELTATSTPTQ